MLDCGDRIMVFDWHPEPGREIWQPATVESADQDGILARLDACPEALTRFLPDHWRPLDRVAL